MLGFVVGLGLNQFNSIDRENKNLHYLPIGQKEYYDDFFAGLGECQNNYNPLIKGLIVNHHLLAGNLVAKGLCSIATNKKITVILLSPNHFNHGQSTAVSSPSSWLTPYGELQADKNLIGKLVSARVISIDGKPFKDEHGVYNIVPFIKRVLPEAKVVPIIIKDRISQDEKNNLVKALRANLPGNSIIISSLDFSHYLTSAQADKEDDKTLKIIGGLDYKGAANLNSQNQPDNVDSKPVLEIMLTLMSGEEAGFKLIGHSNSAKITGDLESRETTSYIIGDFNVLK